MISVIGASLVALAGGSSESCRPTFETPGERPDDNARLHNGKALPDVCVSHDAPYHVFVIGDWGGIGNPAQPAKNRETLNEDVDHDAQQRVAEQMDKRGLEVNPDYVLNVGDSFYWGGIETSCLNSIEWGDQWATAFNNVYGGGGLAGKPWLGVLGNHDYGGYKYDAGWAQMITMSWVDARWMLPAQYWSSRVQYPDFDIDYYFVDTNYRTCTEGSVNPMHNMCSTEHNGAGQDCSAIGGPSSVEQCPEYFDGLWKEQLEWLKEQLGKSAATWRVVVTHIPPYAGSEWEWLCRDYGIDLIVTGHFHYQSFMASDSDNNPVKPTSVIVSGGGGGITSEDVPQTDGEDDQYGFVDLELSRDVIEVSMISHGGVVRRTGKVRHCFDGDPGDKYMVRCEGQDSTETTTTSRPKLPTTTTRTGTTTTTTSTESLLLMVSAEGAVGRTERLKQRSVGHDAAQRPGARAAWWRLSLAASAVSLAVFFAVRRRAVLQGRESRLAYSSLESHQALVGEEASPRDDA